jgi:hypothetical protein
MARHQWYTKANLVEYFNVVKGVFQFAFVVDLNVINNPAGPIISLEINISHPDENTSYDETRL